MAKSGDKRIIQLRWPVAGISKRHAFQFQAPYTCIEAVNCRNDSITGSRERGGTRPGLTKGFSGQLGTSGTRQIKLLDTIQYIQANTVKARLLAVANGTLYREEPVGTLVAVANLGGTVLSTNLLHGAERNQIYYIADHDANTTTSGTTYQPKKYDPVTDTQSNWTAATAGTIPKGCPCIANWRDRLVLGGGTTNPFGLFASKQGDPEDWDYSKTTSADAWSLVLSPAGQLGDMITAIAPHSDNCLLVGCSTSLWILRSDPRAGGEAHNLSQNVGVVDRGAWCHTPDGMFVFLSADGLYAVNAGCSASEYPTSLSRERMPEELLAVDRSSVTVGMAYDLRGRGIHINLTPNSAGSSSATHWWFDWETKSFWKVLYASTDFEPFAIHARKNFVAASNTTTVALGCRDGYVRRFSYAVETDDGTAFDSYIWLGPIGDPTLYFDSQLDELSGTLGADSGEVQWTLYTGDSPEAAYAAQAHENGLWVAGRNPAVHPRARGQAIYIKLANDDSGNAWEYESGLAVISRRGKTRP